MPEAFVDATAYLESIFSPITQFPKRVQETVINNLQSGHLFSKQSAQGTQLDDAVDYVKGSQSLKLITDGAGSVVFTRKINIAPAVDMTGKYIKLWVKVSAPTNCSEIWFYMSSNNFSSAYYSWKITDDISQLCTNEWEVVTLSFGEGVAYGAPNRAAINAIQWRTKDKNSTAISVWLGGISSVPEPTAGVCSITFDDGWGSVFTTAKQKMDAYNFSGTAYIIPNSVDTTNYMTKTQLTTLQDLHGWVIAGHHITNFSTLTIPEINNNMRTVKKWLLDNGFSKGADHFAYPNGAFSTNMVNEAKKFFISSRTIIDYTETLPCAHYQKLRVLLVVNSTPTATIQARVTQAINNKEWLILVFHKIQTVASVSTEYSTANFTTVIADIASQGIAVKTVADVIAGL